MKKQALFLSGGARNLIPRNSIDRFEKKFSDGLPATLAELLKQLDIKEATVAAEIDGEIITRARWVFWLSCHFVNVASFFGANSAVVCRCDHV